MRIEKLTLFCYKNYKEQHFVFEGDIICICGNNGTGKTNLLDAIYYVCYTKSNFTTLDAQVVTHGQHGLSVNAVIHKQLKNHIQIIWRERSKKELNENQVAIPKLSQHIGKYPFVFIAPDDTLLITEGSEGRRKFIDGLIAQLNPTYLYHLLQYNKILLQRNAQLKNNDTQDYTLLLILDEQLSKHAVYIHKQRILYTQVLIEKTNHIYKNISGEKEEISIIYQSQLHDANLQGLLQNNRQKEFAIGRTMYGIHRDDLIFYMGNILLKNCASQGQRKSFLFALKLALYEILSHELGISPLLGLDDIFEKLDATRSQELIAYILQYNTQVFITDTHPQRLQDALLNCKKSIQWIYL